MVQLTKLEYKEVNVFSKKPFKGNPVAIVFDADSLTTEQMANISQWTNFSECVFMLSPTVGSNADFKVRIFSLTEELPFAGHPTIGSAFAYIERNGLWESDKLVMECGLGLVNLDILKSNIGEEGDEKDVSVRITLPQYKPLSFLKTPESQNKIKKLVESLNPGSASELVNDISSCCEPRGYDVGPLWLVVKFNSWESIANMNPDYKELSRWVKELSLEGVNVVAPNNNNILNVDQYGDCKFEIRTFTGDFEDPVCGSGNLAVSIFLSQECNIVGPYKILQGTWVGREGVILHENEAGGDVFRITGEALTNVDGFIYV